MGMDEKKIGRRIRSFREARELSREELAERTGLDRRVIEEIEEEEGYPSLQPLIKIARVLGVRLGTFIDDEIGQEPLVTTASERGDDLLMRDPTGHTTMRFHSLGRGKNDRHMEPFFIEIAPDEDKSLSSHEGEEFIVVHKGAVEVLHGADRHVLEQGDSIYFNSAVPHHVGAAGGEPAEIYAVIYFPQ
jgi:transcriptional regulator with XRE-family HTH domain